MSRQNLTQGEIEDLSTYFRAENVAARARAETTRARMLETAAEQEADERLQRLRYLLAEKHSGLFATNDTILRLSLVGDRVACEVLDVIVPREGVRLSG